MPNSLLEQSRPCDDTHHPLAGLATLLALRQMLDTIAPSNFVATEYCLIDGGLNWPDDAQRWI